jgi:hypothetical protein
MQARPESSSLRREIAWLSLAVLVFGLVALWQPFEITFSPSLPVSIVPISVGVALGVGLAYASAVGSQDGLFTEDKPRQFVVMFAIALVAQFGLAVVPTETILLALSAFGAAIPARVLVYWRYQR